MRNKYEEEFQRLNGSLINMGKMIEIAIENSMVALMGSDKDVAKQISENDENINKLERDIESLCIKLLLQQQPVARDLRVISSALKMISDMERIGDQSQDIAEIAGFVHSTNLAGKVHISEMATEAVKMVTTGVDSFVKKDLALAQRTIDMDDNVDRLFLEVKTELVDLIREDTKDAEYFMDLLMVAKYLERIGDHATNIAEWVIFSITGEH